MALSEHERRERLRAAKARYREKNRELLREKGRAYAERKRRESGLPARGTPESAARLRSARKLRRPEHPNWKGEAASYTAVHAWVAANRERTGHCSSCGEVPRRARDGRPGTQWANISGEYRRDLADYVELCCSCHLKMDMTPQKRAKIAAAVRARPPASAETREKLRQAAHRRWDKSRAA